MREATLDLMQFGGLSPRTQARLLRETMATQAMDVNLLRGDLRPRRLPVARGVAVPEGTGTIYNHCGNWLFYPGKVYLTESLGSDPRLYITGDGIPRVRKCDGTEYQLGIPASSTAPTTGIIGATLTDYAFTFEGWYEDATGQVFDKQAIAPTQITKGKEYTFVPFARVNAPVKSTFCVSMTATKSGSLLGVVYSINSFRLGTSDLYLQGQKATLRLYDRSSGTDKIYDSDTIPSLMAIKVDFTGASGTGGSTSRSYVYTYVRRWPDGTVDESAPSPASSVITVGATSSVTVAGFVNPNRADVTHLRIYRTDYNGTFRFVAELPITATSYTDELLDTELGESLPSKGWLPPPDDMGGMVAMPNGFMIGFAGNTLYPSAVNQEHAFPAEYTKSLVGEKIVGIAGAFENALVVVTKCHPYIVTAYAPDMLTVTKVNAVLPCLAPLSIVDMGRYGVGYASNPGFVVVRAGDAPIMSEPFFTPTQWQKLLPATMRCEWHDEVLHVVSDIDHLLWDMSESEDTLTRSHYLPTALWSRCSANYLWVVLNNELHQWEASEKTGRFIWRSHETSYARPIDFIRALTESEGEVTLRLIADDALVFEQTYTSNEPFHLPVLPRSKHWFVEIESAVAVHRLTVSNQHIRL